MDKSWVLYLLIFSLVLGAIYQANTRWNLMKAVPSSLTFTPIPSCYTTSNPCP